MNSKKRAAGLNALENFGTTPEPEPHQAPEPVPKEPLQQTDSGKEEFFENPVKIQRSRVGRPPKNNFPPGIDIQRTSAYIPEPVHDKLREYVFHNKGKSINDCLMEGIDLFFKKHGMPPSTQLLKEKRA